MLQAKTATKPADRDVAAPLSAIGIASAANLAAKQPIPEFVSARQPAGMVLVPPMTKYEPMMGSPGRRC